MRYWAYFTAKLLLAAGLLFLIGRWLLGLMPPPPPFMYVHQPRFPYDLPSTLAMGAFFLVCCGAVYLCLLDQRYRCRKCLRRLRMPIETGSWGAMLQLGRPRIEYICPFGHGTLKVSEVQILGLELGDWKESEDMWAELSSMDHK